MRMMQDNYWIKKRVAVLSVIGTFLSIPIASFVFLRVFDAGSEITFWNVLLFPIFIFGWQGVVTGLIVNAALLVTAAMPNFLIARRLLRATGRSSNEKPEHTKSSQLTDCPASFQAIAVFDVVMSVIIAMALIDRPMVSLAILSLVWPCAWGLFLGRRWGWLCSVLLHSLVMLIGLVVFLGLMAITIQDFGRPVNHMSFVTAEMVAVVLTVGFLLFETLAYVPLHVLLRNRVRRTTSE